MSEALLQMSGVSKRFGATQALKEVGLEVRAGQVLALIGENGAGKSTLMKILSGAIPADAGEITLQGKRFRPRNPHAARQAGIGMIYQELIVAPDLSVEDNIMLGQEIGQLGILQRGQQRRKVREALNLLGHPELRPGTIVGDLSVGAQQLVEIARALVLDAKVVVFDEPTSSLTQQDVKHLFEVIYRLKTQGLGIIYISHFLEEVREICDSYCVLRDGQSVGSGRVADVKDEEIVSLMVGRSVDHLFPTVEHQVGDVLLDVVNLSGRPLPEDVFFSLHRGEIFGLAGLVGAGRTELLRCLMGLDPVRKGHVQIGAISIGSGVRQRMKAGFGLVSEDRKAEGLAQIRNIADNLTLSRLKPYSWLGILMNGRRMRAVRDWMERLQVKAESPYQPIYQLSGGNQQKVAIARLLHQDADILLFDEPTRGIDVGTKSEIYKLMGQLAAQGKAILFVSSYLPELLAVCDRVGVMSRGRLREVRPAKQWTEHEALTVAIGSETSN